MTGGYICPSSSPTLPLPFFALSFLIDFLRGCREYAPIIRKTIENWKFAVQIEILQKNTCFCLTTTYSGLCSSDHTCIKILFLVGFLVLGVIYSGKSFGVRRSPPKIMQIISASLNSFERRNVHIHAYATVSKQQNCYNSMWKLASDLKFGPLECARSALQTEPNFILGP